MCPKSYHELYMQTLLTWFYLFMFSSEFIFTLIDNKKVPCLDS